VLGRSFLILCDHLSSPRFCGSLSLAELVLHPLALGAFKAIPALCYDLMPRLCGLSLALLGKHELLTLCFRLFELLTDFFQSQGLLGGLETVFDGRGRGLGLGHLQLDVELDAIRVLLLRLLADHGGSLAHQVDTDDPLLHGFLLSALKLDVNLLLFHVLVLGDGSHALKYLAVVALDSLLVAGVHLSSALLSGRELLLHLLVDVLAEVLPPPLAIRDAVAGRRPL